MPIKVEPCMYCGEVADTDLVDIDEWNSWLDTHDGGSQMRCCQCGAAGPIKPSHGLAAPPRPAERDATGIGNPAEQRMAMVRAIGQTNDKLDEIIRLLKDGKIKVVVAEGEAKHAPAKLR